MPSAATVLGAVGRWIIRLRNLSLQWEVGGLAFAGMLILFSLFAALGEVLAQDAADRMASERLSVARLTATFLDGQFDRQFIQLEWAASQIDVGSIQNATTSQPWADLVRRSDANISDVLVVDRQGQVVWSDPPEPSVLSREVANQAFVREPLGNGQRYVSPTFADPITLRPTVVFSVPIQGADGNIAGVLATGLDLSDSMSRILQSAAGQIGPDGHAELVDQKLRLIASSEHNRALGPAEHPTFYRDLLAQHKSGVGLTDPIGDEDPQDRGERHIMAFVPLRGVPWGLGLGGSESAFTATSTRWRFYTLPLGVLALAITGFLVWHTRQGVVAPLTTLTRGAHAIAAGDLSIPVSSHGDGEVRILARSFENMRQRLLQAQEAEAELSRLKDEFLAIASHELRTPVAALTAMTQIQRSRLARGQGFDERQALEDIYQQLDRLARLIGQLLDSSRIQTGKLTLEPAQSDLAELVSSAISSVRLMRDRANEVLVEIPPVMPALVDPLRFEQVVVNLLDNAIKNSPHGKPVRVQLSQPADGMARLTVRDYGRGIPPEQRHRIFDRYVKTPDTAESPGLGLGLYVSREIVALHRGAIAVESPPDGGTAMVVTLPTHALTQTARPTD